MTAYVVLFREGPVKDPEEMKEYQRLGRARTTTVALTPLVVYGAQTPLEGKAPDGVVVLKFDSVDTALEVLVEAGVPAGRVNDLVQAINHPQIVAREMLPFRRHRRLGRLRVMNSGLNFSSSRADVHGQPPDLGQHNRQILRELGYSDVEYRRLRHMGAIYAPLSK